VLAALITALVATAIVATALLVYGTLYFRWEARQTAGLAYFGRPLPARRELKRRIRLWSRPAVPLMRFLAFANRGRTAMPSFEYEGVCGPPRVSNAAVFARARSYQPRCEDVFVVTQMRSGTTWMQQMVYEIVSRGRGDLSDGGHGHLYTVSPWIDGINSVSLDEAPLVGDPPTRIIKSHLPASLCPDGEHGRFIYVARHPVSCFASIVDYNRLLLGPLAPPADQLADWFCSDRMYWLPWPQHVSGWWERAQSRPNVLFVHFEEMKTDPGGVVDRVSAFLGCSMTGEARGRVIEKCRFDYMSANEELFEMAPPTMFSVAGRRFLASGQASRHDDVTPAIRERIASYCREALRHSPYPVATYYADIALASSSPTGNRS
jgi:hypothetical protein